jgi:hypothetical protein
MSSAPSNFLLKRSERQTLLADTAHAPVMIIFMSLNYSAVFSFFNGAAKVAIIIDFDNPCGRFFG